MNNLNISKSKEELSVRNHVFICPHCLVKLNENLECNRCGFTADRKNGMLYLHRTDHTWESCIKEKNGWIEAAKERGIYRENDDHFYMPDGRPHLKEFYAQSILHIDKLLSIENLNEKSCLDLGCGLGWVEVYILKKYPGSNLIAMEVNDDPYVGLGRATRLKEFAQCNFVSLIADMHLIPIEDNSLDIVFTVDALHHFRDMKQVFAEINRVLKPQGRFYAINEPDRPMGISEEKYIAQNMHMLEVEMKYGIIERRPTIQEYLENGKIVNLKVINDELGIRKDGVTPGLFLAGQKQ